MTESFFDSDTIQERADAWVARLNEIAPEGVAFAIQYKSNRKTLRVVDSLYGQESVHAFVGPDGSVYKPAGWKRAAVGLRFSLTKDFDYERLVTLPNSAWSGAYLYLR